MATATAKIYQLPIPLAGTANIFPNFKYMVCGDNLDAITSPGYLNNENLESFTVGPADILQVLYDFNQHTQTGRYNAFSVAISNGVITLSAIVGNANVVLPVVSGNVAEFSGTDGAISDSGIAASNVTTTPVLPVSVGFIPSYSSTGGELQASNISISNVTHTPTLPVVSGNLTEYVGTGGAVQDSNILATNVLRRDIQNSMNAAPAGIFYIAALGTEVGGNVSVNGQCGIITTSSLTLASGDTFNISVTNPYAEGTTSFVSLTLLTSGTNTAGNAIFLSYEQVTLGNFSITILNANSGALNGTLDIGFWIAR